MSLPNPQQKLKDRLSFIARHREAVENGGVILAADRGYLCGYPYLLTSDHNRAFVFKNREQAEQVLLDYPTILEGFHIL